MHVAESHAPDVAGGAPVSRTTRNPHVAEWKQLVAQYEKPSSRKAIWQLTNTLVPYVLIWVLLYWTQAISWWLVVPLAVLAGAFLVRVFIIFHDCGHGSFFASPLANEAAGFVAGVLTFTPYHHWRWQHSVHHASSGHLDRRGGDVWTLTVEEYLESSRWRRFAYRLARNPVVLFGIAPLYVFMAWHRFPSAKASAREWKSVIWTNVGVLAMVLALSRVFGLVPYLLIQLTVMMVAGASGLWLFYIQHQFEDAYWERGENWDYTAAALQGSSFYKLPGILQWISGNIGFHHIHHLSSRIPNYNLERCHNSHPLFLGVKPVTLSSSIRATRLRLWDEQSRKLVGFRHARAVEQCAKARRRQETPD